GRVRESRIPNPEPRVSHPECRPRWASRDQEELERAIWRLLTETCGNRESGFAIRESGTAGRLPSESRVPNPESRSRRARRRCSRNAYAFDLWIAHLALLEQALEVAPIPWHELRAEELDGLLLLRAARERFRQEYHPCAECGAPVKGKICPRCGAVR
ncbi:MAG: hypothetical protein ACREF4_13355, partial [Gammaproteobacteria bacterium]